MEKISFGIIGVGRRGLGHLNILKKFKNIEVKSICDIDEKRLREISEKYGVKPYKDLDKMLREERLDAVAICTPTPLHVSQTIKCIENGLDVMLEKPISLKIDEVKLLLKRVLESKQIVAVSFQSRYMEIVDIARNTIDDTLSMLHGYWYWTTPIIKWIRDRNLGGGQIVDQAIHLIDLYRFFAGEISEVYA
ncbi:MAG TPA: Gfo/Idh/MocA family oxidoreductase, partial [Thermoprotei archaeon]|nr:Gfo/Idh/MocA family oxidoreductase [Thermoprotei archaeon]